MQIMTKLLFIFSILCHEKSTCCRKCQKKTYLIDFFTECAVKPLALAMGIKVHPKLD